MTKDEEILFRKISQLFYNIPKIDSSNINEEIIDTLDDLDITDKKRTDLKNNLKNIIKILLE